MKNIKFILGIFLAAVTILVIFPLFGSEGAALLAIGGVVVTPDIKRGQLALFVDYLKAKYGFTNLSEMDLRPLNIRAIHEMKNTTSQYSFNLKKGYDGAITAIKQAEILLEDDKIFFPAAIRLSTRKISATNVIGPVFLYEDKAHHDDTGEIDALHSLYNGNLSLQTEQVSRINKLANDLFRVVPAQQKEEATDVLVFWPEYGPSDEERGYVNLIPCPILDSAKNNSIIVNLIGSTATIEGASGKKNLLQVDLLGWVFDLQGSNGFGCGVV